jgi:hypothetical protein
MISLTNRCHSCCCHADLSTATTVAHTPTTAADAATIDAAPIHTCAPWPRSVGSGVSLSCKAVPLAVTLAGGERTTASSRVHCAPQAGVTLGANGTPRYQPSTCSTQKPRRSFKQWTCEKSISLFEFSLCLSRACLGTTVIFSIKWRKQMRFSHRCHAPAAAHQRHPCAARRRLKLQRDFESPTAW